MGFVYKIPKDKVQAEAVIGNMVLQGKGLRNPQSIKWYIANYYMQGLREFSALNYSEGTISVSYLNESGILKFRYEEIIAKYQAQLGRLYGLNWSPTVRK